MLDKLYISIEKSLSGPYADSIRQAELKTADTLTKEYAGIHTYTVVV